MDIAWKSGQAARPDALPKLTTARYTNNPCSDTLAQLSDDSFLVQRRQTEQCG